MGLHYYVKLNTSAVIVSIPYILKVCIALGHNSGYIYVDMKKFLLQIQEKRSLNR